MAELRNDYRDRGVSHTGRHGNAFADLAPPMQEWEHRRACRDADPSDFYPDVKGEARKAAEARALEICAECPVAKQCLQAALDNREFHGVWGGTTAGQRRKVFRRMGVSIPAGVSS